MSSFRTSNLVRPSTSRTQRRRQNQVRWLEKSVLSELDRLKAPDEVNIRFREAIALWYELARSESHLRTGHGFP